MWKGGGGECIGACEMAGNTAATERQAAKWTYHGLRFASMREAIPESWGGMIWAPFS